MRTLLVAALCALCAFCGFADKGTVKWYDRVFLGDGEAAAIGEKLPEELRHKYSKGDRTLDLGVAGDRTEGVLKRIAEGALDGLVAKVVFLHVGGENLKGKPADVPADVLLGVWSVVQAIQAKQPKAHVVLSAVPGGEASVNPELKSLCNRMVVWFDPAGTPPAAGKVETTPSTRAKGIKADRHPGPFGDYWWLNRLHRNRELMAKAGGKPVDVVFMGDSITHFWEWKHPESWAKVTAKYSAFNCGYGGDQTQHVLWRAKYGELDGYEAKAVVLLIGVNNAMTGSTAEDTADGIRACVAAIREKQPKAKVILHAIFPCGNDTPKSKSKERGEKCRPVTEATNKLIKSLADGKDVLWLDFNAEWTPSGWAVPKELMGDGTHPAEAGYALWFERLDPILSKICACEGD